jgi:single-strand DNA-binding protein
MPNYNKLVIIGHLTRTPELKSSKAGKPFCKTGIAYNDRDKKAHFFDVVAFGKTAELVANSFEKGDAVGFEGEVAIDKYAGRDGAERVAVVVKVDRVIFLGGGGAKQDRQPPRQTEYAESLPEDDEPAY